MYNQYAPIMVELQHKLHEGGNLFYSWHGGGGASFWNLLAYQAASPLALAVLFIFPEHLIVEAITLLILLKVGLAGATMCYFLGTITINTSAIDTSGLHERTREGTVWPLRIVCACLYALSAYTLSYFWNIMWFDAVALLPLCIAGLAKILKSQSPALYIVALALTLWCNYYIAAMECIFIILAYFALYSCEKRAGGVRAFITTSLKVLAYSFVAAALCAPLLLPALFSTMHVNDFSNPNDMTMLMAPRHSAPELFAQFLPLVRQTIFKGDPNIYCGMISVLLTSIFFLNGAISLRKRICAACLLAVLLVSMSIPELDLAWNFFHEPNGIPFRYSFVAVFVVVGLAYYSFVTIKHIPWYALVFAITFVAALVAFVFFANPYQTENMPVFLAVNMSLLVLYAIVLFALRTSLVSQSLVTGILSVAVILELGFVAIPSVSSLVEEPRETLFKNHDDIAHLVERAQRDNDDAFLRIDVTPTPNRNMPFVHQYPGLSIYASSIDTATTQYMRALGFKGEDAGNEYLFTPLGPREHALLGLSYLIVHEKEDAPQNVTHVDTSGVYRLYRTEKQGHVGYWMPNKTLLLSGEEDDAEGLLGYVDDYLAEKQPYLQDKGVLVVDEMADTIVRAHINAEEDGALCTSIPYDKGWRVYIDGKQQDTVAVAGAFLATHLPAGNHDIELRFTPFGLVPGCALSLGAIIAFVFILRWHSTQRGKIHH